MDNHQSDDLTDIRKIAEMFPHLVARLILLPIQTKRKVSESIKKYVASKQKWSCNICEIMLNESYEIDHINPLFEGGNNDLCNLQALCKDCHGKKTLSEKLNIPLTIGQLLNKSMTLEHLLKNDPDQTSITCESNLIINILDPFIDHLDDNFIKSCILRRDEGMGDLMKAIYFNPNIPQNRILKNLNNNTIEIFDTSRWIINSIDYATSDLNKGVCVVAIKCFFDHKSQDADTKIYLMCALLNEKSTTFSYIRQQIIAYFTN